MSVALRRPSAPRVLFLYGPAGVGKTHLMFAIGHRTTGTVRIVQTGMLTAGLVAAVRADDITAFFERQAACDLLLLEDVDAIAGKPGTQSVLGSMILRCVDHGCRVAMTSSVPLKELPELARIIRTLRTRATGLQRPSETEMVQVVLALLGRQALLLRPNVLRGLARAAEGDLRRLIGAVTRLRAGFRLAV